MTPVFPYLVRRSEDGWRGELLLRLKRGKSAYIVNLSLEQARMLAVEMRGLATSSCPQHHLALQLARAMDADISHIVLKLVDPTGGIMGVMRLVTDNGTRDVNTDPAAALAMAIHMGLPIFMDGDFSPTDGKLRAVQGLTEAPAVSSIPQVFRDVIDELDFPSSDGESHH